MLEIERSRSACPCRSCALAGDRSSTRCRRRLNNDPVSSRKSARSVVDRFGPRIRELPQAHPRMRATVIAERIGWERGLTVLKDRLRSWVRFTCRRTRRAARAMRPGRSPSESYHELLLPRPRPLLARLTQCHVWKITKRTTAPSASSAAS